MHGDCGRSRYLFLSSGYMHVTVIRTYLVTEDGRAYASHQHLEDVRGGGNVADRMQVEGRERGALLWAWIVANGPLVFTRAFTLCALHASCRVSNMNPY
jgi:hypothetical protein